MNRNGWKGNEDKERKGMDENERDEKGIKRN